MANRRIGILGTGSFLPERILSNHDLEKVLDTNDEWIYKRTGIKERRIAAPEVNASDLAKEASLRAMDMAGITAKDIDLIIMTTMTPDTCCPAGANWLEAKAGRGTGGLLRRDGRMLWIPLRPFRRGAVSEGRDLQDSPGCRGGDHEPDP